MCPSHRVTHCVRASRTTRHIQVDLTWDPCRDPCEICGQIRGALQATNEWTRSTSLQGVTPSLCHSAGWTLDVVTGQRLWVAATSRVFLCPAGVSQVTSGNEYTWRWPQSQRTTQIAITTHDDRVHNHNTLWRWHQRITSTGHSRLLPPSWPLVSGSGDVTLPPSLPPPHNQCCLLWACESNFDSLVLPATTASE